MIKVFFFDSRRRRKFKKNVKAGPSREMNLNQSKKKSRLKTRSSHWLGSKLPLNLIRMKQFVKYIKINTLVVNHLHVIFQDANLMLLR